MSNFIRDGLSLDETKTSLLMITYGLCFIASLIYFILMKESESVISMFYTNIAAVTGTNIISQITDNNKKG